MIKKYQKTFFKFLKRTRKFTLTLFSILSDKISIFREYMKQYVFWQKLEYYTIYYYTMAKDFSQQWIEENPEFYENIQLSMVYFFSIITMCKYMRSLVRYYPLSLQILVPFCKAIGNSPFLFFLGHQNYSYIIFILLFHIIFKKQLVKFSKTIQFHILFVLNLEFLNNILLDWVVLLFFPVSTKMTYAQRHLLGDFYLNIIFVSFYFVYLHSFRCGLKREMPVFPKALGLFNFLVESTSLWLNIITQERYNKYLLKTIDPNPNS